MKLIALDVGTKRIGVAKADTSVRVAVPYEAITVDEGAEFKKLASLSRAWDVKNFVIGLPRNASGEETKQSLYVREFAKQLKAAIPGAKVCFQDESLTSVEAEKRLSKRKKGYKKGDVDSEAATIILQDFLEEKVGKCKTTTRATSARRKSVKGSKPNRLLTVVIALVALLVVMGSIAVFYYNTNLEAVAGSACDGEPACETILVTVEPGSAVADVAPKLEEKKIIKNAFIFQLYYRLNHNDEAIKSGTFDFNQGMTAEQVAGLLIHGANSVYRFTALPGSTVYSLSNGLVNYGYSPDAIAEALELSAYRTKYASLFAGMPEDATSLEGYLFGDTYEFYRDDPIDVVIDRLLEEMSSVIKKNDLENLFAARGLNLYQGITLASVVQREAGSAEDMPKIAAVFYNRLHSDMPLGSDVTAIYAADLVDRNRVIYTDNAAVIDIDSPYNTRKITGLPYGPISNPGLDALLAVANPDENMGETLYFLAGDDGETHFASTEEEHLHSIETFCQVLCATAL